MPRMYVVALRSTEPPVTCKALTGIIHEVGAIGEPGGSELIPDPVDGDSDLGHACIWMSAGKADREIYSRGAGYYQWPFVQTERGTRPSRHRSPFTLC